MVSGVGANSDLNIYTAQCMQLLSIIRQLAYCGEFSCIMSSEG